jgi:hypothetical protein
MSRPRLSCVGLVTLFRAFLALALAAFPPIRANAQVAAPLTNRGWWWGDREVSLATRNGSASGRMMVAGGNL